MLFEWLLTAGTCRSEDCIFSYILCMCALLILNYKKFPIMFAVYRAGSSTLLLAKSHNCHRGWFAFGMCKKSKLVVYLTY